MLRMFRFFDAPNAIIITIDHLDPESSGYYFMFSLGMLTQNIALAAVNSGLGTCIDLAAVLYPEIIRQVVGIPESRKIAIGIAIGYPDWDFPANRVETSRESLSNITSWHGI